MPQYIATIRAVYEAETDAEATMIAEIIRQNGAAELEAEDGDTIDVTQVTDNPLKLNPQEILIVLKRARNQLIRVGRQSFVDCAKELDERIWVLEHRAEDGQDYVPAYPHHRFMEILTAIIQRKENPLD